MTRTPIQKAMLLLPLLLLFCQVPGQAPACSANPAQPSSAVFYPDEVQLLVEENQSPASLPSGGKGFVLMLPSGAQRDSFALSINGIPAQGYYWPDREEREAILQSCRSRPVPGDALLPENEASPERRALLEKILPLAEHLALKQGELAGTEARLDLWRKTLEGFGQPLPKEYSPAEDAAKLSKAYAEEYPELHRLAENQRRAVNDARRILEKAQKELNDFDRLQAGEVVIIPQEDGDKAALSYSYVLPASCSLGYRLDAAPDKGEFTLAQDATIFQQSGFAWKDVELYISTVRRDKTLRPANTRPWLITMHGKKAKAGLSKVQSPEPMAAQDVLLEYNAAKPETAARAKAASAPAQIVQEDRGTFRLWSLGKKSIVHGTPVILSLASDTHKAEFSYTLRPAASPKGFLTAELALPEPLELPPGMAQFAVDGAVMGRQWFSFNGDKGIIFFGSDPQVTATMRDLKQTSGEQGFFSKEQTRSWHWQITLKSTRPKPVDIIVEDAAPVSKMESINVITQSMPRPEEVVNEPQYGGARIYRWKATLKPGEPFVIDHQIQVVAPATPDMELAPGR